MEDGYKSVKNTIQNNAFRSYYLSKAMPLQTTNLIWMLISDNDCLETNSFDKIQHCAYILHSNNPH